MMSLSPAFAVTVLWYFDFLSDPSASMVFSPTFNVTSTGLYALTATDLAEPLTFTMQSISAASVPLAEVAPAGAPLAPGAGFFAGAWAKIKAGEEQIRTSRIPRLTIRYLFDMRTVFKR